MSIESENRYYIDVRGGCVAVRDRTKINEWENGLHEDMECVVSFWKGFSSYNEQGFIEWNIHDWQMKKANDLTDKLNGKIQTEEG